MSVNLAERYSEPLVLRVNELFYDNEQEDYHDVHEEMLGREGQRWRDRAQRLIDANRPAVVVDIGSGAGLVGMSVGPVLRPHDRLVCADLSAGMLEVARRNLTRLAMPPQLDFVKIERSVPYRLPFADASADVVTMNSVLHHVKETAAFLDEINRVLRPGGLVMIGHEPNRAFSDSALLRWNYALLRGFFIPKNVVKDVLLKTGLRSAVEKLYYMIRPAKRHVVDAMMQRINGTLFAEGLITKPLRLAEVALITDIRDAEGFYGNRLLPHYELVEYETYHPMSLLSIKFGDAPLLRSYDRWLLRRNPGKGATFFVVYRKPNPDPAEG